MWLIFSLLSAIIWGANYVLSEKIVKNISISSLYFIDYFVGLIVFVIAALLNRNLFSDFHTILNSKFLLILISANIITSLLANLFIALAIQSKNATLSSLIEISYPLFIIILAWLFFKENNLNLSVAIGGAFIFTGIAIIYLFNN